MPIQSKAFSGPVKLIPKYFTDEDSVEDIPDSLIVTVEVVIVQDSLSVPVEVVIVQGSLTVPLR